MAQALQQEQQAWNGLSQKQVNGKTADPAKVIALGQYLANKKVNLTNLEFLMSSNDPKAKIVEILQTDQPIEEAFGPTVEILVDLENWWLAKNLTFNNSIELSTKATQLGLNPVKFYLGFKKACEKDNKLNPINFAKSVCDGDGDKIALIRENMQ